MSSYCRRVREQERQAHGHLQPEVEPILCNCNASAAYHEAVRLKGRAVPSVGIWRILTSHPFRGVRERIQPKNKTS
jgi:hypothetical protein